MAETTTPVTLIDRATAIERVKILTQIAQQHQCFSEGDHQAWERECDEIIELLEKT